MTEEARSFPGDDQPGEEEPPDASPPVAAAEESSSQQEEDEIQLSNNNNQSETFADFSGFDDNFADAFVPPSTSSAPETSTNASAPVEKSGSVSDSDSAVAAFEKVAFRRQSEPEEDLGDSPEDPLSSEPKVIEVIEPNEPYAAPIFSTMGDAKKTAAATTSSASGSLEIDQVAGKKISLGESNESPVTPEELDVQSLAKLESLKESDA